MPQNQRVKKRYEKAVCDTFIRLYESKFSFYKYGNDKDEPDCFYKLNGKILGIEVTTAYYEDIDAKQEWTLRRKERKFSGTGHEERWGGTIKESDQKIFDRVQKEINCKCKKQYKRASEYILCIYQNAPLSDDSSNKKMVKKLTISKDCFFSEIYLLFQTPFHDNGGWRIIKIYPR